MTADRRLRIGGWAALVAAVVTPVQIAILFVTSSSADPAASLPNVLAEGLRMAALLIAVVGLDDLFRRHDPRMAARTRAVGLLGTAVNAGLAVLLLVGVEPPVLGLLAVPATVLVGAWFVGGGLILLGAGRPWARIGWTALVGGLSACGGGLLVLVPGIGPVGETGHSIRDYVVLLGVLAAVYLVRVWSYVVRGRLPGPGIL